jgi:hypothetical protein
MAKLRKTAHQRIDELEMRVSKLETGSVSVTFEVDFYGGKGGVDLQGENLNKQIACDQSSDYKTSFTVVQSKGQQNVYANGIAPVSTNGRIEIQVSQNGTVLSKFSDNVFTGSFTNQSVSYTIQ